MLHTLRIGARIGSADPFWVQTREAVYQYAQQQNINLIPIDIGRSSELTQDRAATIVEELLAHDLNALICSYLPTYLIHPLLQAGLPIIHLTETHITHPLLASTQGFYEIAYSVGQYLAEQLGGRGNVLAIGGMLARGGEDGRSRIAGFQAALQHYPDMRMHHIPSAWRYEHAYPQIVEALRQYTEPIDAIFGLSDSLALAARDAGRALGVIDAKTRIVGINGDPLALAAIAEGSLTATIDTPAAEFGTRAVELACQAARTGRIPNQLSHTPRLVTAANVAEIAMQKLIAIADLPSRLVGVNRRQEQQRLAQLETSLEINRRVGSVLNRQQVLHEISELIRANYNYDTVQFWRWQPQEQLLIEDTPNGERLRLDQAELFAQALRRNEPIFVADLHHNSRFPRNPRRPYIRSQIAVPVRLGDTIIGLLDLHSRRVTHQDHQSLAGLQVLADQLGVLLRNAELYQEALAARDAAEKADQLKTRLLANVTHELRTPLNVILGYSQAALATPNPYHITLPPALIHDLQHIYRSGEHLIRLINDLLDLSRAEIDELELFPEPIAPQAFLEDVFHTFTNGLPCKPGVQYRLNLPQQMPLIHADPVRLRQILLNLLSNASKYTDQGEIVLGAELSLPHLHIWVSDTGCGIPVDLQEQIFEPFVTGRREDQRPQGIGLGLTICRRLVALHRGTMTLESQPQRGSTFHLYLPLPSLSGQPATTAKPGQTVLLLISARGAPDPALIELSRRKHLRIQRIQAGCDINALLADNHPAALAWDLGHTTPADWQLIQQLRSDPRICQAPFILYDHDHSLIEASQGTVGILNKPLSPNTLLDLIATLDSTSHAPILIVDDDAETRELYRKLINQDMPERPVRLAEDGAAALEQLAHETPALVLLDLNMPGIDGFEVLEQLRNNPRTRQVPVVIMSGRILSFEELKRLDHSRVVFYSKDILAQEEVSGVVTRALSGKETLPQSTSVVVKHAIAYIHQHYMADLSRQQLAQAVGVSQNYLSQIFTQELGISPWEYLNRYRIMQAKTLLRTSNNSISAIAAHVGFGDASYFGRVFRKYIGCSPQHYRDHH